MAEAVALTKAVPNGVVALSGFRIQRVLSADLFLEMAGAPGQGAAAVASLCLDRWTDLSGALASLVEPAELFLILGSRGDKPLASAALKLAFLAVGADEQSMTPQRRADALATICGSCLRPCSTTPRFNRSTTRQC